VVAGRGGPDAITRRVEALARAVERLAMIQESDRATNQASFTSLATDLEVTLLLDRTQWYVCTQMQQQFRNRFQCILLQLTTTLRRTLPE
jgi:hypothetical protein